MKYLVMKHFVTVGVAWIVLVAKIILLLKVRISEGKQLSLKIIRVFHFTVLAMKSKFISKVCYSDEIWKSSLNIVKKSGFFSDEIRIRH